jgi:orotidine-5'-phosphate decarboxylase
LEQKRAMIKTLQTEMVDHQLELLKLVLHAQVVLQVIKIVVKKSEEMGKYLMLLALTEMTGMSSMEMAVTTVALLNKAIHVQEEVLQLLIHELLSEETA